MKRKTLIGFLLIAASLATAASRTIQTPATTAPAPVSIPFELVVRHIVLRVKVNNSPPLSFVFDTGDKVGLIDLERARELGLNLQGQIHVGGAGSTTLTGALVKDATWTLPGLEGFSQPVQAALPFGELSLRFGHAFDGIVGSDFIKKFVVEVDYQAGVIRLHDKDKFIYSGPGEAIPIEFNQQGHPIIAGEVTPVGGSPIKGKFVLDLGSSGCLALYSPFATEHRLPGSDLKTIKLIGAGGAGGRTNGRVGRVAELKIGAFKIFNPITDFSEDKAGAFASSALAGNIGEQVASKFKVFLDYDHKRIILEPSATFGEPFNRAQTGFALMAEGQDFTIFRITEVLDNSPASEAGLKKDDVITRVDDRPAAELSLTRLGEMFERPMTHKLTIRRGDQSLQVTFTPRRLI
jgi:PDZ domain/Aspartyl protease